jgi:hypothetical protein
MAIRHLYCIAELSAAGVRRGASGHWPDFHSLDSDTVAAIVRIADKASYRAPRNRNGSRARYAYAAICREADRERGRT